MAEGKISLIVLAGGSSRRMGSPKAAIDFAGEPLLTRVLRRLHGFSDDVIVVTRDGQAALSLPASVHLASDTLPDAGPLAGLTSGLEHAQHPLAVVLSCDLPFVSPEVLGFLKEQIDNADAAVPLVDGRRQPLHAVYRTATVAVVGKGVLGQGLRRMDDLLDRMQVVWVQPADMRHLPGWWESFININTPRDLQQALATAAKDQKRR